MLLEHPHDRVGQKRRTVGTQLPHWRRHPIAVRRNQLKQVARERWLPRDQLIGRHAQRILIRRRTNRLVGKLFRAHVERRTDRRPRLRQAAAIDRFRDAEVGKDDVALQVDQDVCRLHIAVDNALGMRIRQRPCRVGEDPLQLVDGDRVGSPQQLVKRATADQTHDEEDQLIAALNVMHHDDVRVLQTRRDAGLLQKALGHTRRQHQPRVHHLDGHRTRQFEVLPYIHHRHTPTPELTGNVVHADGSLAQPIEHRVSGVVVIGTGGQLGYHGTG